MLIVEWILGLILILSSLGVILARKPVYSALSFLVTLLILAALYMELWAQFISVMQVLVYAGAILVIFMFVIVLFQDAHEQIQKSEPQSNRLFLSLTASAFLLMLIYLGRTFINLPEAVESLPEGYGTVRSLGRDLYIDYFFPFEAVTLIFLIALIGAVYTGKKIPTNETNA